MDPNMDFKRTASARNMQFRMPNYEIFHSKTAFFMGASKKVCSEPFFVFLRKMCSELIYLGLETCNRPTQPGDGSVVVCSFTRCTELCSERVK